MGDLWGYKNDPEHWGKPGFPWWVFWTLIGIVAAYWLGSFLLWKSVK